jgi:4-hydroxy-tetrahydrodipicolinate reductase
VTSGADVVVDFSAPRALEAACVACAKAKIALVSGTTGLDENAKAALGDAATRTAVIWEPNMSVGVHVLAMLVAQAEAALGAAYDVEVVEIHHRAKVDAPSGTAIRLADVVKEARGAHYVHGRQGRPGPRDASELGVHAVRGGDVVGEHTVYFFGDGERVELTHKASSRDLFAHGALRAARWLAGRAAGRYALADVIRTSP